MGIANGKGWDSGERILRINSEKVLHYKSVLAPVSINGAVDLADTGFTIAMWVNIASTAGMTGSSGLRINAGNDMSIYCQIGFNLNVIANRLTLLVADAASSRWDNNPLYVFHAYSAPSKFHLCITASKDGHIYVYINGVYVGAIATTIKSATRSYLLRYIRGTEVVVYTDFIIAKGQIWTSNFTPPKIIDIA